MIHHTIFTWSAEPAGVDDSQSAMIQMICIDLVAAEGSPILGMCSNTKKGPWTLVSVLFSKLVTRNIFWDLLNFRAWGICSIYTPHPSRLRTYDWPWTKRVPPKSGSLVVQESPHLQWPHNPYNQQPKGSRRNCFSPGRCRNPKAHVARTAPHLCDAPQGRVLGAWTHYTRAMWLSTLHHLLFRSIRHYQI